MKIIDYCFEERPNWIWNIGWNRDTMNEKSFVHSSKISKTFDTSLVHFAKNPQRDLDFESIIFDTENSIVIFEYSYWCRADRWPEAEPYILKMSIRYIYLYIVTKVGGRWPECESYICQDEYWGKEYLNKMMGIRPTENNFKKFKQEVLSRK